MRGGVSPVPTSPGASLDAVSTLDLPPTTESVPTARRFVREALTDTDVDVDTALLLVSEVVTNAVLHARSQVRLEVGPVTDHVRIEVHDGSPLPLRLHTHTSLSATGRGLRLLEQLSRDWGCDAGRDGKTVWFEVGAQSEEAWTTAFQVDDVLTGGSVGDR